MKKKIMQSFLVAVFALAGPGYSQAADVYSSKSLKNIVPFGASRVARLCSDELRSSMGVAESRLGANGIAGAAAAGVEKQ
jgi:tripartite-type tricarboxylate transporter receptor subunit TctC